MWPDPVVVIGAGGLGLMAIEVLKALGGKGAIVVGLARRTRMAPIPVTRRPLDEAQAAMEDLHHGRVVGRTVLIP